MNDSMNNQAAPTNSQRIANLRQFFRARLVGDAGGGPATVAASPAAPAGRLPTLLAGTETNAGAWAPTQWPDTQWSDTSSDPQPWETF
jgi:hypothetical protein